MKYYKLKPLIYILMLISNNSFSSEVGRISNVSSIDQLVEIICDISSNSINLVPILSQDEIPNKINTAPLIRFKTNSNNTNIHIDNINFNNINIKGLEFIDKDGNPIKLLMDSTRTLGKTGDMFELPKVPVLNNRKESDNSFRPVFIKGDNGLFIDDHKTGQFSATADITINCGRE